MSEETKAANPASPATTTTTTNNSTNSGPQLPEALANLNISFKDREKLSKLNNYKLDAEDFGQLSKHFDEKNRFMVPYETYKKATGLVLRFFHTKYAASRGGEYGAVREAMDFSPQRAMHWIRAVEQVKIHGEQHVGTFCRDLSDEDLTALDGTTGDDHQAETVKAELEKHREKVESKEKRNSTDSATFKATMLTPEVVQKLQELKTEKKVLCQTAVCQFARYLAEHGPVAALKALDFGVIMQREMPVEAND